MKITFPKSMKSVITLEEATAVKRLIDNFKAEKETKVSDYISTVSGLIGRCYNIYSGFECLKAEAEIAKNGRIWNYYSYAYGEDDECGSRAFDVWCTFYLYSKSDGFYEIGIYLSDIYNIDGTPEFDEEIMKHVYINEFTK